jgi:decaprenyl-phosphate phosphoribosyltransferase
VIELYPGWLLELMLIGSVVVAIFAYAVWASQIPTVDGFPWRPITIVPFVACLLRYAVRVRAGAAEAPEDVLLSDRLLQLAGLAWLALFALGVNAGS